MKKPSKRDDREMGRVLLELAKCMTDRTGYSLASDHPVLTLACVLLLSQLAACSLLSDFSGYHFTSSTDRADGGAAALQLDGGRRDAGHVDGAPLQLGGGQRDAGGVDGAALQLDGGVRDAGSVDGSALQLDGGPRDAGSVDGSALLQLDGGPRDAGSADSGVHVCMYPEKFCRGACNYGCL